MTTTPIIVHGTLTPDGNLSLDQNVSLPAGRVQITIDPMPEAISGQKDWWQRLQEARAILDARGTGFRSEEEIEAEHEAFRAENNAC